MAFINDDISEIFDTELSERGLSDLEVAWSLAYVQGDGVAFSAKALDLSEIRAIQGTGQEDDEAAIALIREALHGVDSSDLRVEVNRYGHIYNFDVEIDCYNNHRGCFEDDPADPCPVDVLGQEPGVDALATVIREWLIALSRGIEHLTSDEAVAETCEANDYRFDHTGAPVHHLIETA